MVKSKTELEQLLRLHKSEIASFGVTAVALFGSFVRDSANEKSDVDLYIHFDPARKNFDNFMELAFFLEELLGRKVDIVTPESLDKYIGPHVLKKLEYVYGSETNELLSPTPAKIPDAEDSAMLKAVRETKGDDCISAAEFRKKIKRWLQ